MVMANNEKLKKRTACKEQCGRFATDHKRIFSSFFFLVIICIIMYFVFFKTT